MAGGWGYYILIRAVYLTPFYGGFELFYHNSILFAFFSFYLLALLYTGLHLVLLVPGGLMRLVVALLWGLFGLAMPLGRWLGGLQLQRLGGTALGFVAHFTLAFLLLDVWRLLFRLFPSVIGAPRPFLLLNLMLLWMAYGVARAQYTVVRDLDIVLPLPPGMPPRSPMTLVAVSDIHAGGSVNPGLLDRIVRRVAECGPDVILLVGDTLDGHRGGALESGIETLLSDLSAPLGKFAVLGNHELYAGEDFSRELLERAGFTVLQDDGRVVDGTLLLVGRNDPRGDRLGSPRAPLENVLARLRRELPSAATLPLVVADHTPEDLEEPSAAGTVLQVSGHTHGGQVFPFNLLVRRRYGVSSGWGERGGMGFYVSSGAGFWHMPLRTVSSSEIVRFTLRFVSRHENRHDDVRTAPRTFPLEGA